MAAFPFPHELHVQVELSGDTLTIATIVLATGDVACRSRSAGTPTCACRTCRGPSGGSSCRCAAGRCWTSAASPRARREPVEIEPGPLGERTYDDLFVELDQPARFAVEGGGRRIELALGAGYPLAQVFAPRRSEPEPTSASSR